MGIFKEVSKNNKSKKTQNKRPVPPTPSPVEVDPDATPIPEFWGRGSKVLDDFLQSLPVEQPAPKPAPKPTPKKKKEDGVRQAEKILLTWMIEDAGIFEKVKEYISPQDFVNPLFKDVADKLYAQYESGSLNPAAIISTYDAEETHSEVAAMFSMELDNRLNHNEREKALNDTVLKVKNNSIQYQIDQAADPAQIQQLYTMKNKLSAIHITL